VFFVICGQGFGRKEDHIISRSVHVQPNGLENRVWIPDQILRVYRFVAHLTVSGGILRQVWPLGRLRLNPAINSDYIFLIGLRIPVHETQDFIERLRRVQPKDLLDIPIGL
jgi:hypothetical protein